MSRRRHTVKFQVNVKGILDYVWCILHEKVRNNNLADERRFSCFIRVICRPNLTGECCLKINVFNNVHYTVNTVDD